MAVREIRVGGRQDNASYQYDVVIDDHGTARMGAKSQKISGDIADRPDVNSDQEDNGARMNLIYDPTLWRDWDYVQSRQPDYNNAFGQRQISTIYQPIEPVQSGDGS